MTNHHWAFSIEATRQALGLTTLLVINDFTALALALPHLSASELLRIGGGEAEAGAPLALIGPGTGLGVSALIPYPGGHAPLSGEGGHVGFAPSTSARPTSGFTRCGASATCPPSACYPAPASH